MTQFSSSKFLGVILTLLLGSTAQAAPRDGFSSTTTVELHDGTIKSIEEVKLGDYVMVSHQKYQPVLAFGHKDKSQETSFVQINMKDSNEQTVDPLEVSGDHLVYLFGEKAPVPASAVKVGDLVQGSSSSVTVTAIKTVTRAGLYAPITPTGTLIVNGVVASGYDSLQKGESYLTLAGFNTRLSYHSLSHMYFKPLVLYCKKISSNICEDQTFNEGGISAWSDRGKSLGSWIVQAAEEVGGGGVALRILGFALLLPFLIAMFMISTLMELLHWMLWMPTFFILTDLRNINRKVKAIRAEERALQAAMREKKKA